LERADLLVAAGAVLTLPRKVSGQLLGKALNGERHALGKQGQEVQWLRLDRF
jgi:hypothetical protein